jgi:spore maturation protein SpmA
MLNYIWLGLMLSAVLIGGFTGTMKELTVGAFDMAKTAVMNIALPLAGIMALWLGMMRLAERAGLIQALARLLRPIMVRLFPDVPHDHPAMGSMLMNMGANMLGLGNAATPLGLQAMKHLETLNRRPGTATNAMCTFLAINTSSIQLIPATAVGILAVTGSTNPTAIIGTAFVATLCAAVAAITSVKLFEKLKIFRLLPVSDSSTADSVKPEGDETMSETHFQSSLSVLRPFSGWNRLILAAFLALFAFLLINAVFPGLFCCRQVSDDLVGRSWIIRSVSAISLLAIPFLLSFFPLYATLRGVKVYEEFVEGAKEGFQVSLKIIPYLVAILVAIGMFRAAGGIELLTRILSPVLNFVHFPTELLPLALMRPLSGSGSLGLFAELVKTWGPDHILSRMAGTLYGSTETTFYVIAVYFGAVGIKRTRHAVPAGLIADLTGIIMSVIICWLVFH